MYKNNVLNKGWVVIVILLFVGMSMLPVSGSISIERVSADNQISFTLNQPEENEFGICEAENHKTVLCFGKKIVVSKIDVFCIW